MEVGEAVRPKGRGALGRNNRRGHHGVRERNEIVIESALLNPSDDTTSEWGLTTGKRSDILTG